MKKKIRVSGGGDVCCRKAKSVCCKVFTKQFIRPGRGKFKKKIN